MTTSLYKGSETKAGSSVQLADWIARLEDTPARRTVLSNGLIVVSRTDPTASVVSAQVWVRTGSIHEAEWLGCGLSHFLEHLVFKGSGNCPGPALLRTLEDGGGSINAYTSFDRTVYYVDIPGEGLDLALRTLAEIVLHPSVPQAEFGPEREVVLREIAMGADDPDQQVSQALFETSFRIHPYRYPVIGFKDRFSSLGRDDVLAYHARRYLPNNMIVVLAGDLPEDGGISLVENWFGQAARGGDGCVFLPPEPPQMGARQCHLEGDVDLARFALGFQVPGLMGRATPALDMAGYLLGNGRSSRLWRVLRDREQLVYEISGGNWTPGDHGLFYIDFLCEEDKLAAARDAVFREIDHLSSDENLEAELSKAIHQCLTAEIRGLRSAAGQAAKLGIGELVIGDLAYGPNYLRKLIALRPDEVRRAVKEFLIPSHATEVQLTARRPRKSTSRPVRPIQNQEFREEKLTGGGRFLWLRDDRLPNVHLRLVWPGGAVSDPAGQKGISQLHATLLTRDAAGVSAAKIAERMEAVGSLFGSFCGNNSIGLQGEALPTQVHSLLETMKRACVEPDFLEDTVARERQAQIAALREDHDDIARMALQRARRHFFGEHPLGWSAKGEEAHLSGIAGSDLRNWHAKKCPGTGLVAVACGSFQPDSIQEELEEMMERLPAGEESTLPEITFAPLARRIGESMEREQAVVVSAFPGPGAGHPDFTAAEILDECLSGLTAHLFEEVRERRGLAYFVRSGQVVGRTQGMFFLYAGTRPDAVDEVLEAFGAEVARIRDGGLLEDELRRSRVQLLSRRRFARQSNSARAGHAATQAVLRLPFNDEEEYARRLNAVTLDDLAGFARKWLLPDHCLQYALGPGLGDPLTRR